MIDQLRSSLDRHAAEVVARPDPYANVLRRYRHRRLRKISVVPVALAAIMLVAVPTIWLTDSSKPYVSAGSTPPAHLLPLLNSPTRGSLAGDAEFLAKMREHAADEVDDPRGDPARAQMPDDPNLIRVLFAGDIGSRRIAVVAGLDGRPLYANFQGRAGDDADALNKTGYGDLEPAVGSHSASDSRDPTRTYLLLGPTGAVYQRATTTYTATGVQRSWTRVADGADYLGVADLRGRHAFRILVNGEVVWETTAGVGELAGKVNVDPQPVGGRGRPLPEAAQQIAGSLSHASGLSASDATFRVLWSDEIGMPGTTRGRAYVVTVQAVTAAGGGPFLTATLDTGDGSFRNHPTGYGVAGDPEHTLIAMRLPHYVSQADDRLQLIAPPAAVRAEVASETQTHQVTLANGLGHLDLPRGTPVTVRAYDAAGVLLATKQYIDLDGFGCDMFDPSVCAFPPPTASPTRTPAK